MITNKRTTFYVSLLLFIIVILFAGSTVEANPNGKYNSSNGCSVMEAALVPLHQYIRDFNRIYAWTKLSSNN